MIHAHFIAVGFGQNHIKICFLFLFLTADTLQNHAQFLLIGILQYIVICSCPNTLERIFLIGSQKYDPRVRVQKAHLRSQLQTAHSGHLHIKQIDIITFLPL